MRRLLWLFLLVALALPATTAAVLTPGRTITNEGVVTALSVTHRSVVWAVGESEHGCGHVRLWDTATKGVWTFGSGTLRGCEEGPSGGAGFSRVATSGRRVFWVTYIGGNFTDYRLWTATPTRKSPRLLASVEEDSDDPSPLVLGVGSQDGVPYAVGSTVTYVSDAGARLFRTTLDAPVRLLAAGPSFGAARVIAALDDGRVVVLSRTGAVVRTYSHAPRAVRAVELAYGGPVIQVGSSVSLGWLAGTRTDLPAGATMLDYRQRTIYYRLRTEIRARAIGNGSDVLVRRIPVEPWRPMLFSMDVGFAWATGTTLNWRS